MAVNPYFNHFSANNEQTLIEDLIVESIKIYAHDMQYIPRTGINKDEVLNEYEYSEFNSAIDCEFYIKSASSFEGQGLFMEKFGLQIKDQITLTVSKRSFEEFVTPTVSYTRPLEGDLIWVPMISALYEVSYIETALPFYQLGTLQTYDITLELYESTGDTFNTGITELDTKYAAFDDIANDPYDQSSDFEGEANTIMDFSETNPFTDGY
ncbi:MAG: hypothetical protein COA52_00770 [Hyphomicrobiales bacterium]|nr:MAG: hypothetical protein COA52_00770 [Hyphomicrobiales bacterium]